VMLILLQVLGEIRIPLGFCGLWFPKLFLYTYALLLIFYYDNIFAMVFHVNYTSKYVLLIKTANHFGGTQ